MTAPAPRDARAAGSRMDLTRFLTALAAFPLLPPEGAVVAEDEEDEDVIFPLSLRV